MPIAIDSESAAPIETPVKTDEDGRAQRLIRSSDTVTISSLYPAISFTPVSGQAMELFLAGDVTIKAQRLVEQQGICRQLNDRSEEELVYRFFNITDEALTVETDEYLNQFTSPSGTPLAVQAPQVFESGEGKFTLALSELRSPISESSNIGATWRFLASELSFSFRETIDPNPIPVCEGAIVSPCSPIPDQALQAVVERATAELTSLFNYATKIKKKMRGVGARLPYPRTGAVAIRNIRVLVSTLRGRTYTCGVAPYHCRQARFPRAALEKHFETIFSSPPSVKQKEFKRYGNGAIKRFRRFLAERFPSDSYICE
ncbi:MAG: hypothetical protein RL326_123 [Pseudomonadota bacterium]